MLFVQSKKSQHTIEGAARVGLLDKLQEKGLAPLVRGARQHCYELALVGPDRVRELERIVAAHAETENDTPYVRGDIFCFEDFALFLLFGDAGGERSGGLRSGIVYTADTLEVAQKLDAFCRNVDEAVEAVRAGDSAAAASNGSANGNSSSSSDAATTTGENGAGHAAAATATTNDSNLWQTVEPRVAGGFTRFAAGRGEGGVGVGDAAASAQSPATAGVRSAATTTGTEHLRVLSLLEDGETRRFLRRLIEAKADGRTSELLSVGSIGGDGASEPLIGRLSDAGLVRREVLVSCRKQSRSLFRLPSQDALAVITGSNAVCSECGASIADERAEELVTPTELAASVLKDSSWMANRLRAMLVEFGLAETDIALRPASGDGEVYAMANVSGETFLFLLRDGDVNASHARRALDTEAETGAAHIAVIATGKIQDEARVRLREHARRRARTGSDIEVMLVEGVEAASAQLRHAFERVSQRMLAEELCQLDSSLGINFGHMISARFRLMQRTGAPLRDLAASAAGAVTGSLREF